MHLETNKTGQERLWIGDVFNQLAVDPSLDAVSLSSNAVLIPLAILVIFVSGLAWRDPVSSRCLTINITGLTRSSHDFYLRPMDAAVVFFGQALGSDLTTRIQSRVHLDFETKFKIRVVFLGAQKRVRAFFRSHAQNGVPLNAIDSPTIALLPAG